MPPQNLPQPVQLGHNAKKQQQLSVTLVLFVIFLILTLTFCGLFIWAYLGLQDWKNNVQPKIDAAVKVAVQQESDRKDNEFLEKEKSPYKTFTGSDTFGSVKFSFPKTWSAYVISNDKTAAPVDGYLHPDVVPDINGKTSYALRIRVLDKAYSDHMKTFEAKIKQGKITAVAYAAKNQPKTIGTRLDGEINVGQKDHMVVLPLRDKTIEISTESDQFKDDFEKIVLESFNFTP